MLSDDRPGADPLAAATVRRGQRALKPSTVLNSVLIAFLVWLTLVPLVTAFSPTGIPLVQTEMLSHRHCGVAFLAFLVAYIPLHLLGADPFPARAFRSLLHRLRRVIVPVVVYLALSQLWDLSEQGALTFLVAGFFMYELHREQIPARRRLLEVACVALAVVLDALTSAESCNRLSRKPVPAIGRILLGCLIAAAAVQIALLIYRAIRRRAGEQWLGHLAHYACIAMAMAAYVRHSGAGSRAGLDGVYLRHGAHLLTAALFLGLAARHAVQAARRGRARDRAPRLLSVPITACAVGLMACSDAAHAWYYLRFTTPVVNTTGVSAQKVTAYSNLRGYRLAGRPPDSPRGGSGCGGEADCHADVSAQHDLSAHGRAFVDKQFQHQLGIFVAEKGRAAGDYCLSCHAPLGVIAHPGDGSAGEVVNPFTTKDPLFTDGVGCLVCHRAKPAGTDQELGNASLIIRPLWLERERYLGEDTPEGADVLQTMIQSSVLAHVANYHLDRADSSRVCAACHVVDLPESLANDGHRRRVSDQYTSFASSDFAKAGLTCAACHQPRMATLETDKHTVAHNYLGSGTSLPYADPADDAKLRTTSLAFLNGLGDVSLDADDLSGLPPCSGDLKKASVQGAPYLPQRDPAKPFRGTNGGIQRRDLLDLQVTVIAFEPKRVRLRLSTTNVCGGHSFPSGGGIKGFLDLRVLDGRGALLGSYGGLRADGRPVDVPTNLGTRAADLAGDVISDRRFWRAHQLKWKRAIAPGETIQDEVTVDIDDSRKPRTVDARWMYLRSESLRDLEDGGKRRVPAVVVGSRRIDLAAPGGTAPAP